MCSALHDLAVSEDLNLPLPTSHAVFRYSIAKHLTQAMGSEFSLAYVNLRARAWTHLDRTPLARISQLLFEQPIPVTLLARGVRANTNNWRMAKEHVFTGGESDRQCCMPGIYRVGAACRRADPSSLRNNGSDLQPSRGTHQRHERLCRRPWYHCDRVAGGADIADARCTADGPCRTWRCHRGPWRTHGPDWRASATGTAAATTTTRTAGVTKPGPVLQETRRMRQDHSRRRKNGE